MRYFKSDGTFQDHPCDADFGWYLDDIIIDEATPAYEEKNQDMRKNSNVDRSERCRKSCKNSVKLKHMRRVRSCDSEELKIASLKDARVFRSCDVDELKEDVVEESYDVLEYYSRALNRSVDQSFDLPEIQKPVKINIIDPGIKEETSTNCIYTNKTVEGFIENPLSNFYKEIKNYKIPDCDDMMALIEPVNPESKALLSVISYSKYKRLDDKKTTEDVLRTVNLKATNSKHFMIEREYCRSPFNNGDGRNNSIPTINFLLNDDQIDIDKEMVSEIHNYHATKEENMLSLMMEVINIDLDSNLGDVTENNDSLPEVGGPMETSDLGNSIHSSLLTNEGFGSREKKSYLDIPNRSDILSSIGLSDDIDISIECFALEKTEMLQQLTEIKRSFDEDRRKLESLMNQAKVLQNDLRETTFLDNIIHLLNSQPEKVKNRKLPFRIFHDSQDGDANQNFII